MVALSVASAFAQSVYSWDGYKRGALNASFNVDLGSFIQILDGVPMRLKKARVKKYRSIRDSGVVRC